LLVRCQSTNLHAEPAIYYVLLLFLLFLFYIFKPQTQKNVEVKFQKRKKPQKRRKNVLKRYKNVHQILRSGEA